MLRVVDGRFFDGRLHLLRVVDGALPVAFVVGEPHAMNGIIPARSRRWVAHWNIGERNGTEGSMKDALSAPSKRG